MAAPPGPPFTVWHWHDVFVLNCAVQVVCPDCDERSPELDDVYALARWTVEHANRCTA